MAFTIVYLIVLVLLLTLFARKQIKGIESTKKFDEKAVPFKTKLDSGQGLVGNRGKDYLKQRLKFLNFRNTFKEAQNLSDL